MWGWDKQTYPSDRNWVDRSEERRVAGRTGTAVEVGVREGGVVQTPTPPNNTGKKIGAVDIQVAKEVCRRRRNDGLGDGGKYVRSAIGAHRRWGKIREVSHRRPQDIEA